MGEQRIFNGTIGRTLADTKFSFEVKESPSKGKPNVIYIVLDDVGFAQIGCYGSNIHTPNIDSLAQEGIRYNNFHTTAICSATRASLLTGANHHSCGVDNLIEFETGLHNGQGGIDPHFGTMAEILKEYDYRTMAIGKWHLNAHGKRSAAGPFDNWPLGKGFDTYYGFLADRTDQWNPILTRDNSLIPAPKKASEGYHLSEDLTDQAIQAMYHHHMAYPEQPFFLYLAYGAAHAPHHAPKEYIDHYKGKFDQGWDKIREEWFANQKRLGIIPQEAELTERNEQVKAWDSLSDDQKKAYARYMEVFAGFLEHTDAQIGRVLQYLRDTEQIDNTIIVFLSDNGASSEGGQDGHYNLNSAFDISQEYPREVELTLEHYDTIGDEYSEPHYPVGWANAGNTPFQWYKIWTHEGGVRDPLIIRYPKQIKNQGGVRGQFAHVSDVTPTVLDMLGFEKPTSIKGIPQNAFEGISFANTFESAEAPAKKTVQYFEIYGNRAIYKDGWKAVVNHMFNESYAEDEWELYHVEEDYSEKYNVADQYPEKLEELKEEWLIQASRYHVFPMPLNGFNARRDQLQSCMSMLYQPAKQYVYKHILYPFDLVEIPNVNIKTNRMRATLLRKEETEDGVIFSQGDRFGGVSFYVKDNHLKYVYNANGDDYFTVTSNETLPLGRVEVEVAFTVIGKEHAKVELFINGKKNGETEVTVFQFSSNPNVSLKANKYISVYDADYDAPFEYQGVIDEIVIDVAAANVQTADVLKKEMHVE